MDDSTIKTSGSCSSKPVARSAPALTSTLRSFIDHFPFMRLPPELRLMVYRESLVSVQQIHVTCSTPRKFTCTTSGARHPDICTGLLRVCRHITAEALLVLYRENSFVFLAHHLYRKRARCRAFSDTNFSLLRSLRIIHPCKWDHYTPGWAPLNPQPAVPPNPDFWRAVLGNLDSLTVVISIRCVGDEARDLTEDVANHARKNSDAARPVKAAMRFYDAGLPTSVVVHRRVLCDKFKDGSSQTFEKTTKKCDPLHRYIEKLWLEDSAENQPNQAM